MKNLGWLLLSVLLVVNGCGRGTIPPVSLAGEGLTLSAQGEAASAPDQIQVNFSLGSLNPTAKEALLALEEKHKSMVALLKEAGIATDDLKMTSYNLNTERRWDELTRSQIITGFRSNKDFSLNLDFNEEIAGKVYETLSNVPSDLKTFFSFNILFGLKDPSTLEQEALAVAIAKAKSDAQFIADSAGVKLKGISSITPDQAVARPVAYKELRMASPTSVTADSPTEGTSPVNVNDIKVSRKVVIVWRLAER